jgi:GNAT superfamily N-acetyltransferase
MRIREAKAGTGEAFKIATLMKGIESDTAHVKVNPEYAGANYDSMMEKNIAHMFILETDDGKMVGGMGCVVGPDLHFPRIVAVETYWYVDPDYRGDGMLLLRFFEQWAKDNKCDAVAMIHLEDSSPDSLEKVYKRRRYVKVESHYIKEIKA